MCKSATAFISLGALTQVLLLSGPRITLGQPGHLALSTASVSHFMVRPGQTLHCTISGIWWAEPGEENTLWCAIVGFRDIDNVPAGTAPQLLLGAQPHTLPLDPGEAFSDLTFDLLAPDSVYIFSVYIQMVPVTSADPEIARSEAVEAWENQTSDILPELVGRIWVVQPYVYNLTLDAASFAPESVSGGDLVGGQISGWWWSETGAEYGPWYIVVGFRDSQGHWAGPEPVCVENMEDMTVPVYPGQQFQDAHFALAAPTTTEGGTYTLWAMMTFGANPAEATASFKNLWATSEMFAHQYIGSVTVAPSATDDPTEEPGETLAECGLGGVCGTGILGLILPCLLGLAAMKANPSFRNRIGGSEG